MKVYTPNLVIPAKAGIHLLTLKFPIQVMGPRLRGGDETRKEWVSMRSFFPDQSEQLFDMGDWRVGQDSMPEVEDMRTVGER
mgnify:FL=1